jgi:FkbM family methyltransferase
MEYFGKPFLQPVDNEVYVDAGSYTGDTVIQFNKFSGGNFNRIFGFEPDTENFHLAEHNIAKHGIKNCELICKGTWSDDRILYFAPAMNGGGEISSVGEIAVPVTSIDSVVKDEQVTLVKMDIEGAELETFKGAAKTIKQHKPRLAVCIYHKPQDIIEIPAYLIELVPEYKFYIRHHSQVSFADAVLYAIND